MIAWDALKAASSLLIGTAWQLITNPKQGSGLVMSDGVSVQVSTPSLEVTVGESQVSVSVSMAEIAVAVDLGGVSVEATGPAVAVAVGTETIEAGVGT